MTIIDRLQQKLNESNPVNIATHRKLYHVACADFSDCYNCSMQVACQWKPFAEYNYSRPLGSLKDYNGECTNRTVPLKLENTFFYTGMCYDSLRLCHTDELLVS